MSSKLLKSAFVISAMTLLSRISGLIRDVLFANILGSQAAADAFFVAFRLPNFFRRIFGEGAFAVAFVPVFSEYRIKHPPDDTRRFLELMTGRFGLTLLLVTLVGVLAAPALVAAIAPGFLDDPEKYRLAVDASRITFPYLFFISLVAMSAGMLNSCDRFAAPAATPVLLNLSLIGAALFLVPVVGNATIALSIGVFVAGLAQLLFQLPFLKKEGLVVKPRVARREGDEIGAAGVKQVLRLTLPALFGVSVAQINVLVNTLLASFLATGSISWLYYSDRLMEFPVGVFGIALSTAILPHLSRKHTSAAMDSFSHTLDWALRWVFLIAVPATVGLILLAGPLITTIYHYGAFTDHDVNMAAASLVAYALGLTALVLVKVLAPGFYARQNTKTPVKIGVFAMGVNILCSLALFYPLKHVGLALATSIAAFANAGLLFYWLRREGVLRLEPGWRPFMARIAVATLAMGLLLGWGRSELSSWLEASAVGRGSRVLLWVSAAMLLYAGTLLLTGLRPRALLLKRAEDEQSRG